VLGIRPGQMKDAALTTAAPSWGRRASSTTGSLRAPFSARMSRRRSQTRRSTRRPSATTSLRASSRGWTPRSRAGTCATIEFYLDTKELHFFDPETHLAIDDAKVVSRKRVLLSP
jgi:hypothetical protein